MVITGLWFKEISILFGEGEKVDLSCTAKKGENTLSVALNPHIERERSCVKLMFAAVLAQAEVAAWI
jgi:hypothetical protein